MTRVLDRLRVRGSDSAAAPKGAFRWWRIRPYPLVFPAVFVILAWGSASLHPAVLLRPLVVILATSLVVTILTTWLARDRDRGALWSLVVLIMLTATDGQVFAVTAALAILIGAAAVYRRGRDWRFGRLVTTVLGGVSVVLSIALVLRIAGDEVVAWSWAEFTLDNTPRAISEPLPNAPDLIVILLDAYPGERANQTAGASTDPFPASLAQRGFRVQDDSHSNYLFTGLTLGSMFQMRHLHDPVPRRALGQGR